MSKMSDGKQWSRSFLLAWTTKDIKKLPSHHLMSCTQSNDKFSCNNENNHWNITTTNINTYWSTRHLPGKYRSYGGLLTFFLQLIQKRTIRDIWHKPNDIPVTQPTQPHPINSSKSLKDLKLTQTREIKHRPHLLRSINCLLEAGKGWQTTFMPALQC